MSYWKSKVLPRLKKLLKKGQKNPCSVEVCGSFDQSKEDIAKEIEDKKEELQPKVVAIYKSTTIEGKGLLKEPTESRVTENSEVVQTILIELANAGCPGALTLSDALAKQGLDAMSTPIAFLLSKTNVFLGGEEPPPAPAVRDIPEVNGHEISDASKLDVEATTEIRPEISPISENQELSSAVSSQ